VCPTCRSGHPNLCPTVVFAGHGETDGGLRELVAWPTELLRPLPAVLSDVDGALLEPLGVAVHAVDLAHVRAGSTVGVFGCGPIGLLAVQVARAAGATTVIATDPLRHRRDAALRLGADHVWDPDGGAPLAAVLAAAGPADSQGIDAVIEAAGTDAAVVAAMTAARPGARVVLAGIPGNDTTTFPASLARRKGLTLLVARRMKEVYPRAIRLVEEGRVDLTALVSDRYPLAGVRQAFDAAATRDGLKVVVTPRR
jgi:L-iditol 2-dehydrogenase